MSLNEDLVLALWAAVSLFVLWTGSVRRLVRLLAERKERALVQRRMAVIMSGDYPDQLPP